MQRNRNQRRRRNRNRNRRNVQQNSTLNPPVARSRRITNTGALKTLTIRHREFVKDVIATDVSPAIVQMEVNPGIDESFPWLAGIATRFESYSYTDLAFEYVPVVGTITNGAVAIVPDYDAADDNSIATKSKLLSYEDCVRGPVWGPMTMRCSRSNLHKKKEFFVRHDPLRPNLDIKTYDVLSLTTVVTGVDSAVSDPLIVGELWVNYNITFYTPQLEPEPPESARFLKTGYGVDQGEIPYANLVTDVNTVGVTVDSGTNMNFTEPGKYLVNNSVWMDPLFSAIGSAAPTLSGAEGSIAYNLGTFFSPILPANNVTSTWQVEASNATSKLNPTIMTWRGFPIQPETKDKEGKKSLALDPSYDLIVSIARVRDLGDPYPTPGLKVKSSEIPVKRSDSKKKFKPKPTIVEPRPVMTYEQAVATLLNHSEK